MLRLVPNDNIISNVGLVNFGADSNKKPKKTSTKFTEKNLETIKHPLNEKKHPVKLPDVSFDLASKIIKYANKTDLTVNDYLLKYLKHLGPRKTPEPEPMVSANVGHTKITTLIDGEQIFDKTLEYVRGAKKSIQVEMFEFQNLKVDGDIWPSKGAETITGWEEQQKLLKVLVKKKKENPDLKVQVLLDAHKWYMDGTGEYHRHYNNSKMIKHLNEHGIDVLPYPRAAQQGANLQHVKLLAVDSEKVIIGGMNWGTHSVANHDVCVAIEPQRNLAGNKKYKHTEVDNIIEDIFNKDWKFALQRMSKTKPVAGPLNKLEQFQYTRLRKRIKPENVEYMNVVGHIFNEPEFKDRYDDGDFRLPEVKPLDNPAIKVLTNKPKELSFINEKGSESIGEYLKEKVNTADKLRAELFVLSHKEIVKTITKRVQDPEDDFDVKILVSPDILEAFPYTRKFYQQLLDADVPIREYKCDESVDQRLHTKLAIFEENNKKDVILGSANWSAVGLEQNIKKGTREDYYLTLKYIDNEIVKYLDDAKPKEKQLNLAPLGNEYSKSKLMSRKKVLKRALTQLKRDGEAEISPSYEAGIKKSIILKKDMTKKLSDVYGYYKLIQDMDSRKEKYKRGNNEAAIVFESPKIANNFLRQFDKDWKYSKSRYERLTSEPAEKHIKNVLQFKPIKKDFEKEIILATKGKEYIGAGLYTDKEFINWKKVGWENLKNEPFDWAIDNKKDLAKNMQAYWHALGLAETNDTTWVRRYNKYNVLKPLATNHTLSSRKAKEHYAKNLEVLLNKNNQTKGLDKPLIDKDGKLAIDFVVFDYETTGVDPLKDKVVQIGAVKVKDGKIEPDTALNQLVNPGRPIPEGASKVHRIYDKDVKDAPQIETILKKFSKDYMDTDIIVAYNSKFDVTMLNKDIRKYNSKLDKKLNEKKSYKVIDPFIMLQRIHPYMGAKKTLSHQYKFLFGQDLEGAHDAFVDVSGTVDVMKYCVYYLNDKRKDKTKPLTVRDLLLFQNGKKPKNLNFNFDKNQANADVNFDASYRKVSISVDNFFDGYNLSKNTANEIKKDIGEQNYNALIHGEVVGELMNLSSDSEYTINPRETMSEMDKKNHGAVNANYVMKENYKEMLDLIGIDKYGNKSKEDVIDFITDKAKHYIKEAPVTIWYKNPKLYDKKEGNDLPDIDIAKRVMDEKRSESKEYGEVEGKELNDILKA